MAAGEYQRRKLELWPTVTAALDRLRAQYDVVVVEGAGSPAEINLQATDLANMRVARHAQAPVLLVGDIDRGGVFAALLGTLELLEPEERALVRGFAINKFRGDPALLAPGPRLPGRADRRAGARRGPVPADLDLPEEDSLALDEVAQRTAGASDAVDIAVDPAAAHRQLRRVRPAGRRAGRRSALRRARRRSRRAGPRDPPRHQDDDRRPRLAARDRPRRRLVALAGAGRADPRDLRRLPDARPHDPRPARQRVGRGRGRRARAAAGRDDVRDHQADGAGARAAAGDARAAGRRRGSPIVAYEIHMGRTVDWTALQPLVAIDERSGELCTSSTAPSPPTAWSWAPTCTACSRTTPPATR